MPLCGSYGEHCDRIGSLPETGACSDILNTYQYWQVRPTDDDDDFSSILLLLLHKKHRRFGDTEGATPSLMPPPPQSSIPRRPPPRRPARRHPRRQPEWLPIGRSLRLLLSLAATAVLLPRRGVAAAAPAPPTAAAGPHPQQPQQPQHLPSPPHRVTIVGSGNFGSAVARLLARNVLALPHLFAPEIRMWVFEEMVRVRL
jgi:hypothetical protein